jgi:hypothetical protein
LSSKLPPRRALPAGTSTLSSEGRVVCPWRVSSASMRSTSARACSDRPRSSSQRGDSGSERRHHSSMTIGSALISWTIRQPSDHLGMTRYPSRAANTQPNEKKPASEPMNRPRYRFATNSARNGAMIALSAPVPTLAATRHQNSIGQLEANAAISVARL